MQSGDGCPNPNSNLNPDPNEFEESRYVAINRVTRSRVDRRTFYTEFKKHVVLAVAVGLANPGCFFKTRVFARQTWVPGFALQGMLARK